MEYSVSFRKISFWIIFEHFPFRIPKISNFRSLKSSVTALGNTFLYVVVLSAADLLVVLSIPLTLSNYMIGSWEFGEIPCKIFYAMETSNKVGYLGI